MIEWIMHEDFIDEYTLLMASGQGYADELIRCRDCKHHHWKDKIPYCDRIDYGYGWTDDDYCSKAERKEE